MKGAKPGIRGQGTGVSKTKNPLLTPVSCFLSPGLFSPLPTPHSPLYFTALYSPSISFLACSSTSLPSKSETVAVLPAVFMRKLNL